VLILRSFSLIGLVRFLYENTVNKLHSPSKTGKGQNKTGASFYCVRYRNIQIQDWIETFSV